MLVKTIILYGRIASLQQQLDEASKEIDEMKAARKRQTEMVSVDQLLCIAVCCRENC